MPCSEKRARLLLERGRARVHKLHPFTIRLVDRTTSESTLQDVTIKLDPGSRATGVAVVRVSDEGEGDDPTHHVLHLSEVTHRGATISEKMRQRAAFRRRRRSANLRHRAHRFKNRARPGGWLAPSLRHRVETTDSWVRRYQRLVPITNIVMELVRFDTRVLSNPEIKGVLYQRGELFGYEVKEYLLEKWNRRCAYCDVAGVPLQVEHIVPRARGGSNRISNLTLACVPCNRRKGAQPIEAFLGHDRERLNKIKFHQKVSLRDAAAVNSTRWALWRALSATELPVRCSTGGRTKWNRVRFGIPKTHALDAACVGFMDKISSWRQPALMIQCVGRGAYKRTHLNRFGFPRSIMMRRKQVRGFQTGDHVRAIVPSGVHAGTWTGRVAVRATGTFKILCGSGRPDVNWRHCRLLQRGDGYGYSSIRPDDGAQ